MQPPKVLLLENVAAQAAAARNVLVGSGCRLVISRFEADGRKKIREWGPDVIFLADTYPSGGLTAFCRQLRSETSRPFRLILASSHTRARLSREEPDLELFVDDFVLRPFNPEEIREIIGGLGERGRPAAPDRGEKRRALQGKAVLVLDRDAELHRVLREHLSPQGVELQIIEWEKAIGAVLTPRPAVILLGWPLPDGFLIEDFRKIQGGGEGFRPNLLLLSSSAREVVQAKSPAVLRVTNMLFTKPVAWKHFFRFLEQSLEKAPAPEAARPPVAADEEGMRRRFQEELEAKFLEVEELKRRLREAEKVRGEGKESAAGEARSEENRKLREKIEEVKRQGDIELAKLRLRETDLEVKLSNLIRKKIDAERRAQDLIDEGMSRSDEMQRALEDAVGELQMRQEEQAALKADLEQSTIEKEKVEEQLQVFLVDMEKGKKALLAEKASFEEEKKKARETLSRRAGSVEEALEAKNAEISGLAEKLRTGEEVLADRDGQIAVENRRASQAETELERLRQIVAAEDEREREQSARAAGLEEELQAKDAELSVLNKELEAGREAVAALEKGREEKEAALRNFEESLKASEEAVAGLDGELSEWRSRLNEAGEQLAGFKTREEDLVGEKERLTSRVAEVEKDQAEKTAGLEAELKEKAGLLAALENGLKGSETGLVELGEKLKTSEETLAGLDGELSEAQAELERLRADESGAREEESASAEKTAGLEAELKEKAGLLAALENGLEAKEAGLVELEESLKTSEEAVAGLDGELSEVRGRLTVAEESVAGAEAREEELRELKSLVEEREAVLIDERHRSSEVRAELERLRAEGSGAREEESAQAEKIAGLEAELKEKAAREEELKASEEAVAALDGELSEVRRQLTGAEESVSGLDGELAEVRRLLTGTEKAAAALEEELDDRRHRMVETEAALADLTAREAVLAREKEERGGEADRHDRELREWKQRAEVAEAVGHEYDRVKSLLEDVVSRAQTEVIERARKEMELQERLKTSLEEKKFILSRLERELANASEREMRLTALLESAVRSPRGSVEVATLSGSLPVEAATVPVPVSVSVSDNLPVALPESGTRPGILRPPVIAAALILLLVGGVWLATRSTPPATRPPVAGEAVEAPPIVSHGEEGSADPRAVWEEWTRRDVSGGVILQATLRSEAEIAAEIEAEKIANGWSRDRAAEELSRLLEPYRFNDYIYFYLYLKNMEPGYPGYVEKITDHLVLRDEKGNEAKGFLPPEMEKHRRVYSFTAGGLSKRDELIYEVAVPVAFSRKDLSPDPAYIELLAFNIGSSSRRVLTWELQ